MNNKALNKIPIHVFAQKCLYSSIGQTTNLLRVGKLEKSETFELKPI